MSINSACKLFGVSRQVYYRSKRKTKRRKNIAKIVVDLVQVIRSSMRRIGGKKLYHMLYVKLRDLGVGRDKFFDILRANKLLIKPRKSYHITTDSHHRFKKHKNLIKGIVYKRPEEVWVSDITYIGDRDSPQYLSLVTDAYSKKIVGYNVSDSLSTKGAASALRMALNQRAYKDEKLIHHSDRGIQYCSLMYQDILKKNGIICSMTEQYDPYENAIAERVNGILKQEFLLGIKLKDLDLMSQLVGESIAIYNQRRPHESCYLETPEKMHMQREIEIRTYRRNNNES